MDEFMESNLEIREVVRVFDETISLKASKADLKIFKEKNDIEFVKLTSWNHIQAEFDKMKNRMGIETQQLMDKFEMFREEGF